MQHAEQLGVCRIIGGQKQQLQFGRQPASLRANQHSVLHTLVQGTTGLVSATSATVEAGWRYYGGNKVERENKRVRKKTKDEKEGKKTPVWTIANFSKFHDKESQMESS